MAQTPKKPQKAPLKKPGPIKAPVLSKPAENKKPQVIKPPKRVIASPVRPDKIKQVKPTPGPAKELLLSEYVAALRRELEAVALIAAPDDNEVPGFHVADASFELALAVKEVSDDGITIIADLDELKEFPPHLVQRMKVRMIDPDVEALEEGEEDEARR